MEEGRMELALSDIAKVAVLAGALGVAGCADTAGGPQYLSLSVSALEDGSAETMSRCTPMPIMPGGRTSRDLTFVNAFGARVEATRDRVNVTFTGILEPDLVNRTLPRETLEDGFGESGLRVETVTGRRVTVGLTCPCPSSSGP
jgi:hypothetical protein